MRSGNLLIVKRAVTGLLKNPWGFISGLGMSLFFLAVYSAGIGGIGFLPQFENGGYTAFILPLIIISLSIGSTGSAGQALNRDIQSGYFYRLYLTPVLRITFVAAPVMADMISMAVGTSIILIIGFFLKVPFAFGFLSFAGVVILAMLLAVALSGISAGLTVLTENLQAAQITGVVVFSMMFLSTTFLPFDMITSSWMKMTARINPLTYILEGMRFLLAGSSYIYFISGFMISLLLALISLVFAYNCTRKSLM